MSLQWTIIAGFLYVEIAIVLLLVLPIFSPKRLSNFFKSRFLLGLRQQAGIYFMVLLVILVLFLLDAIREMRKYSHFEPGDHQHLDAEMQGNMRLFRAQRNFYISGFSLFLSLVIRRLVILITDQATLLAQSEAAIRQAQSASSAAKTLLAQRGAGEVAQNSTNDDKEVTSLKEQVKELELKLAHELKDKFALKNQSENLHKEYDRLTEEYSKLQKKMTAEENKKDD